MATFQIKVTPKNTQPFGTEHLIVGTKRKAIPIAYPKNAESLLESIRDALQARVLKSFEVAIGDQTVKVRGFDKMLALAKFAWKSRPSDDVPPGKHKLRIEVKESAGVDDDDQNQVELILAIAAPPEEDEAVDFDELVKQKRIVIRSSKVRGKLGKEDEAKAVSIYLQGSSYGGHGPTEVLGSGVVHAHVTNRTALGFKWKGNVLEIVGWGEKSDSAGKGTSGYNWTT